MKNRYMNQVRQDYLLEKVRNMCKYSKPDDARISEHEAINAAFLECMETVVSICPDNDLLELTIRQLWIARNSANGCIATHRKGHYD